MSSSLNLNPVHSDLVTELLKLTRYQQTQRLKSISHCFKNSLRIREDEVYSGDEVRSMITALKETVEVEVETELTDSTHTNVLLLHQLLLNAETWHLTLTANISELEDREKLNLIKEYDDQVQRMPEKMGITVTQSKQVIPMQDMQVATVLRSEIEDLSSQNEALQARIQSLELEMVAYKGLRAEDESSQKAVSQLKAELEKAQEEIRRLEPEASKDSQLAAVQTAVRNITSELEQSRAIAAEESERLRKDLESREDKLRSVQSNLLLKEKELDQKFQATTAYLNMKKILLQKNKMIKGLRTRLAEAGLTLDLEQDQHQDEED